MENKNIMNESRAGDTLFNFYLVPFLSSYSLLIILSGKFYTWGNYLYAEGYIARIGGSLIMLIPLVICYNVLIKIPKINGGMETIKVVSITLLKSSFFYVWLFILILVLINIEVKSILFKWGYIALLGVDFILQMQFVKKIKSILNIL